LLLEDTKGQTKMNTLNHSYIVELIDGIIYDIKSADTKFTNILGVSRGGLIPAVYISYQLGLPLAVTSYSSNKGNGDGSDNPFCFVDDKNSKIDKNSVVLVVDDICDTGNTLSEIIEHLTPYVSVVKTATLQAKAGAMYFPTFCSEIISENDGWQVYPWEKQ